MYAITEPPERQTSIQYRGNQPRHKAANQPANKAAITHSIERQASRQYRGNQLANKISKQSK